MWNLQNGYWTGAALTGAADDAAPLTLHTIEGVEPLDAQFGVFEPMTVPAALRDALFGQSELIKGSAILPLHTYAILDAAKVIGLIEMLETSGLDHTCLFKGEAAQELRDVAPYLVRLEEANAFTRKLFTKGDAGWQMWDNEPGIYLRSTQDFQSVWKHFRKFVKVKDYTGRWLYVRFWEPVTFGALTKIDRSSEQWLTRLLMAHRFFWPDVSKDGHSWFAFGMGYEHTAMKEKIIIGPSAFEALDAAVREQHETEDIRTAQAYLQNSDQGSKTSESYLISMRGWLRARGFQQRRVLVSTMQAIAEKFPEGVQPPPDLVRLLSDRRKGAALRLWHVENWQGPAE